MQPQLAKEILAKVKSDYNNIAPHFSETRAYSWQEFEDFKQYLKPGLDILDLGCGNGRFYEFLEPFKINYTGVDNSSGLLDEAVKKFPQAKFIIGDMLNVPIDNNQYDIVFSIASLHHIPSDELRLRAAKEIYRLLKKDGILIMTNWNLFQDKYKKLFGKKNLDNNDLLIPWKDQDGKKLADRYYHAFTEKELSELADKSGFIIKKQYLSEGEKNIVSIWKK
ncbi:class I SAM-dependent methyltransferase [Patescibacteria group bacterium]|nr:class I SAM-dependent methyltransferase [Patescibacteria group bacterium]